MRKFGAFLARKPAAPEIALEEAPFTALAQQPEPAAAKPVRPPQNPLELDEELFSVIGAQLGGENETLRNLLLDANAKIGELDTIKAAVGRLVDPVSNTLRAIEAEKSEKLALQTVLNNTRAAYGKLRNEITDLEKRLSLSRGECQDLRQELANTQNLLRTAETTRSEIAIEVAARRAQIAELEAQLAQETGEAKALHEENQRLDDRLNVSDKRVIALESDLNATRQRLLMAEDEKRAQQASLDRAGTEQARLSRKLAETEASLNAAQSRLRHVEANYAEVNTERARLATALDEANERNEYERANHRTRFEALQARAGATEKLLGEAREHLLARAEEIRDFDRKLSVAAIERDGLQARISDLEAERITRDSELREVGPAQSTLKERSAALARAYTAKESALERAETAIAALTERLAATEAARAADKQAAEQAIEELIAELKREKLERSMTDGALETARKDFARVAREVMALQRNQAAQEAAPQPRAANAA
jgi:chromosome segregation ATPase